MKYLRTLAILAALAAPLAFALPAQSATMDKAAGGFSGPVSGAQADTVAKALTLGDDAPVVLTGNIVSQVAGKKDKFIFKDATGEVRMEIDRKVFAGQSVTPENTVRIVGKVDKDLGKDVKIEAKSLEIVK
ncbi:MULTISPECIES: NirD/YgiW/YdeI family stress tolerance protein [unclassified Desulfovibrio]|uniref:YgiW/YdeI family stress tolerance OB fold protein n=1 Tax=unclassified Desulfovibrio TaxID=2593640 RepID=UPI0013EB772B|nr:MULTISPECIES: NirD/YgiW/YdeI family stress tolerance protein [unclassified Desulfovibrio]